ncbi:MAG: Queuosine synthesis [Acidobacteria bacterium]|nr:Queuosine synthesis [Acidobacteriota bacterium]
MRGAHRSGKVHCSSRNQDPQRDHYQRFGGSRYINLRAGCDNDIKPDSDPDAGFHVRRGLCHRRLWRTALRAIVLLSGGLDSAVALYWAKAQGWDLLPLEFEYYLRPGRERRACRDLCDRAGIRNGIFVPIPFLREVADTPGTEIDNPALAKAPQGYVPLRNLIFYALAAYHAELVAARYIVGGHNRTDCESFPDAGSEFWNLFNCLLHTAMWSHPQVQTEIVHPLIGLGKVEVLRLGMELGVPFELTWSCYHDAEYPCGACESCIERVQAFAESGILPG